MLIQNGLGIPPLGGRGLANAAAGILAAYGTDSHVYLPGAAIPILGPELIPNSEFDLGDVDLRTRDSTGTEDQPSMRSVSNGKATVIGVSAPRAVFSVAVVAGKAYQLTVNIVSQTGTLRISFALGLYDLAAAYASDTESSVVGIRTLSWISTVTATIGVGIRCAVANTIVIESISVKEITEYTDTLNGYTLNNYLESMGSTYSVIDGLVGLNLDAGGAVGSELIVNGNFNTASNWTIGVDWFISSGTLNAVAAANATKSFQSGSLTSAAGKTYKCVYTINSISSGGIRLSLEGVNGTTNTTPGTYTEYLTAAVGSPRVFLTAIGTTTAIIDNVSVKEVTGVHVSQSTTANKPFLRRGTFNIAPGCMTATVTTIGCAAVTGIADPYGASEANTITSNTSEGEHFLYFNPPTTIPVQSVGTVITMSVFLKAEGTDRIQLTGTSGVFGAGQYANFSLVGSGSILAQTGLVNAGIEYIGNSWYRAFITAVVTTAIAATPLVIVFINSNGASRTPSFTGVSTDSVSYYGVQAEVASAIGPFAPTYDVTGASAREGNFFWELDGTNDNLISSIPWYQQNDDHCTIVAFSTNSFASTSHVCNQHNTDTQRICNIAVTSGGVPQVTWRDNAGVLATVTHPTSINLSTPVVISGRNSGGSKIIRNNGVQNPVPNTVVLGTTTVNGAVYGSHLTNAGYLKGRIYGLIAIKGTVSDSNLLILEKFLGQLAGVVI